MGASLPSNFADDYLLGMLAARKGLITEAQLEEAVAIRQRSHPTPRLIDVIIDLGRVRQDELAQVCGFYRSLLLGSTAVRLGIITQSQLDEALGIQSRSASKPLLGKVLYTLGYLSKYSLRQVINSQENALTEALLEAPSHKRKKQLTKQLRSRRTAWLKCTDANPHEKAPAELVAITMVAGLFFALFIGLVFVGRNPSLSISPSETLTVRQERTCISPITIAPVKLTETDPTPALTPPQSNSLPAPSRQATTHDSESNNDVSEPTRSIETQTDSNLVSSKVTRAGIDTSLLSDKKPHNLKLGVQPVALANKPEFELESWGEFNRSGLFVMSMVRDLRGCIWVGTEDKGIFCYNPKPLRGEPRWRQYTTKDGLGDNNVYALSCDMRGRIWAGHLNSGISIYNGDSWKNYGVEDSLIGERVFCIASNQTSGDVWVATSWGLCQYEANSDSWKTYTRADGLPADQVQTLGITPSGLIIAGTQCDGLAIGRRRGSIITWTSVRSPFKGNLIPPKGRGLPCNQINDILATSDEAIFVATSRGVSWSRDAGVTWYFVRGRDWLARTQQLYCPDQASIAQRDLLLKTYHDNPPQSQLFAEDYITCLAQDAAGRIWIGHRSQGYEAYDPREDRISETYNAESLSKKFNDKDHFVSMLLHAPELRDPLIAWYGNGVTCHSIVPAQLPKQRKDIYNSYSLSFPSNAKPLSVNELSRAADNFRTTISPSWTGVVYEGEDWTLQGDWLGRYGRCYAILCGGLAPFSRSFNVYGLGYDEIQSSIGPHSDKDDGKRNWVHWPKTDNPRSLFDPILNCRRQAEWDDHGESYDINFEGPDIWSRIHVPEGYHRISLYFYNKDGHDGRNRFRDYLIKIRPWAANIDYSTMLPVIAQARVRDFWGGVYKSFYVPGPATYWLQIERNYSFNTIVSAIFIDAKGLNDDAVRHWTNIAPGWDYSEPRLTLGDSDSQREAFRLWSTINNNWSPKGIASRRKMQIECYRAMLTNNPDNLAYFRWHLGIYNDSDRAFHSKSLQTLWDMLLERNRILVFRNDR
jgi:hypothetical protein